MKTFRKVCAQGELGFTKISDDWKLPGTAEEVSPLGGQIILGHSESGHHHVMTADRTKLYKLPDELLACLIVSETDVLRHLREFDTHEPIQFEPGRYFVKYLREETPQGFRRQID